MKQAIIFTLLSCTMISAAPAVAKDRAARQPPFDWVLVEGDNNKMSGSMEMVGRARGQQQDDEPLLYVERDGRAWVFREQVVIDRVRASWAPADALGKKMGKLGDKMSEIGDRQSALGKKMGAIGNEMGRVGREMAGLHPDDDRRERLQAEMERLQEQMEPLQEQMQELNAQMQPYSDEMSRLGKEMSRLSARAQEELADTVDDALASGLGREVK